MKKSVYLWSGLISMLAVGTALAQLPASPWDTAEFDAAIATLQPQEVVAEASATTSTVQETGGADVIRIGRTDDSRVYVPSVKYKAINADASDPVYVPAIDSVGNSKAGAVPSFTMPSTAHVSNSSSGVVKTHSSQRAGRQAVGDWRGSGQFGKLNYTGEVTTYGTAYGQEMLAPEVNNHNMKVMLEHLRNLGYKIPESYDTKFQNFTQDYAQDLRRAYDGLGHQNNPFDTMFSGILDVVEEQSGLDMENLLFNSIDLIAQD